MTTATPLPVAPDLLAAMTDCLVAVHDMALLSRAVFDRFLRTYPDEAARFINVDAAVLRMTDETFVLLHGLASGEGWAAGSAAHWVDLHRNYGPIASARYRAWTALCIAELERVSGDLWIAAQPGWAASASALDALLIAENERSHGISQPADH
jgi:hypothetical protein